MSRPLAIAAAAMIGATAAATSAWRAVDRAADAGARGTASVAARSSSDVPAVVFTSHRGEAVRFAEAVRDRVVVLAFGYVRCTGSCPRTNGTLREVQRLLGDHVGRDVHILSVSLDPEHDTPATLAQHASTLGAGPGWTFLTGDPADVDALRRHFGLFDRYDPSAPRTSHSALVLVGGGRSGRWYALPGLGAPEQIAEAALRLAARARAQGASGDPGELSAVTRSRR